MRTLFLLSLLPLLFAACATGRPTSPEWMAEVHELKGEGEHGGTHVSWWYSEHCGELNGVRLYFRYHKEGPLMEVEQYFPIAPDEPRPPALESKFADIAEEFIRDHLSEDK